MTVFEHHDHFVQNIVGVVFCNAQVRSLQTCAHAGDGAVVIRALDVNHFVKTTIPFIQMIGDIGHKIGVAAVGFAHHAVFVIAKIRGAQPQRTAFFVGVPHFAQARHGLFHRACSVQRRLKKIVVESHTKRLQIQILLAAQIRHRKITHSIQIINVFLRGHAVDGFTCKVGVGNIDDVITAIAALRKRRIVHAQTLATRLHRNRQIGNLLTRVIVVKLAVYVVALTAQHRAENIAERGLTRMPHVQRSRWIGGYKFEHHALTLMGIG